MKTIICLVAVFLAINASPVPVPQDLGLAVKNYSNKFIKSCIHILPKSLVPVDIKKDGDETQLYWTHVKIEGLEKSEIIESVYNETTRQFHIYFTMPMNFQANFSLRKKVDTEHVTGYFNHNGSLHQIISDKVQLGISFFLTKDETSGDLVVEKLKLSYPFSVEDVLKDMTESNTFLNIAREWQDKIRDYYDNYTTTNLNKFIAGKKTVDAIIDHLNRVSALLGVYCKLK